MELEEHYDDKFLFMMDFFLWKNVYFFSWNAWIKPE